MSSVATAVVMTLSIIDVFNCGSLMLVRGVSRSMWKSSV